MHNGLYIQCWRGNNGLKRLKLSPKQKNIFSISDNLFQLCIIIGYNLDKGVDKFNNLYIIG
jgi:hypothetical protein